MENIIFLLLFFSSIFYNLNAEVKWNTMRQRGKRVPREICIQGTITIENNDEPSKHVTRLIKLIIVPYKNLHQCESSKASALP